MIRILTKKNISATIVRYEREMGMNKYSTQQRRVLIDYFDSHRDQQLTVREIAEGLETERISVSAVYRNLSDLAEEGKIKKILKEGSRETSYQFTDAQECRENLHLICRGCGKTVHLGKEDTERLAQNLSEQKHFKLDKKETVLYGLCEACNR